MGSLTLFNDANTDFMLIAFNYFNILRLFLGCKTQRGQGFDQREGGHCNCRLRLLAQQEVASGTCDA